MAYNKSDLVSKIAQKSNLTKAQAEAAVNAFQDVFVEAMQSGEGLKLTGLFSAERVKRAARTGRNPRTGETIEIPGNLRCSHFRRFPAEEGCHQVIIAMMDDQMPRPRWSGHLFFLIPACNRFSG